MIHRYGQVAVLVVFGLLTSCATKQDIQRVEGKLDQLIQATNRSTLEQLFGQQADEIRLMVNQLGYQQKQSFSELQEAYADGTMAADDVRQQMLTILGNNDRVVSTQRGIYVRDLAGAKLKAIPNGTKIANCRLLAEERIPEPIREKAVLQHYSWGQGELDGDPILFPWELTISSFAKEIAEHTARRTAEEFLQMGGEAQWRRPIKIQISTEKDDLIKVSTNDEENEVYLEYQNIRYGDQDNSAVPAESTPEAEGEPGATN